MEQYWRNAVEHVRLLEQGDEAASRRWEVARSRPSYDLLLEATAQSAVFYSVQATRSLGRARWSAAAAIGSEALLLGLLAALSTRGRLVAERRLMREREHQAARFEALVHHAADVIAVLDGDGVVRYASPSLERVLGYEPREVVGRSGLSFLDSGGVLDGRGALERMHGSAGDVRTRELPARHADGSLRWIEVSARNLLDDEDVDGIVLNCRDVTAQRTLQDQLRHQALHDPLTGIANRKLFGRLAERSFARARREVARMFLKQRVRWDQGERVRPVDLVESSEAREAFSLKVFRRSVLDVEEHWKRMVFSGRDVPPPQKGSEEEVLEYVAVTPGAVGYVSATTPLPGRVKVIRIID